jgi:hypothetical protein
MAAVSRGNTQPRAYVALADIPSGIRKLSRRVDELKELAVTRHSDFLSIAKVVATKVNATIEEVFGHDTAEASSFHIDQLSFWSRVEHDKVEAFNRGRNRAIALLETAIGLRRATFTATATTPMPSKTPSKR